MNSIRHILFILYFSIIYCNVGNTQCYQDDCHNTATAEGGCCSATTSGMTWSGYGDYQCLNMNSTNPDVWLYFEPSSTGVIQLTFDNITQDGITQYVMFRHESSAQCNSLNAGGQVIGYGCNNLAPSDPNWVDTVDFNVVLGEHYWILVSIDVESGGTAGDFELCIDVVPPAPPTPGQDCTDAAVLCVQEDFSQGAFTGVGVVEEISDNSCFGGDERASKWYTFTVSQAGTLGFDIIPTAANDYDFAVYNTTSGCYTTGVTMGAPIACNWVGSNNPTGINQYGNIGDPTPNPCSEVGATDCATGGGPNSGCQPCAYYNDAAGNYDILTLTAGETYAILIDNFTVGSGFSVDFGGTAIFGPQGSDADFTLTATQYECELAVSIDNTAIPNYIYYWDYGNGDSYTGSTPPDYNYTTPGTYYISLTITDALGCSVNKSAQVDLAACSPLPVIIKSFDGEFNINNRTINLSWLTESEINNDYFIVERSMDGKTFEEIGRVKGAGNSTSLIEYNYVDHNPMTGNNYYRLTQIDFDGTDKVHKSIIVSYDHSHVAKVVPNPTKGHFELFFNENVNGEYSVEVYNLMGSKVYTEHYSFSNDGIQKREIFNFSDLPRGIYVVNISNGLITERLKLILD